MKYFFTILGICWLALYIATNNDAALICSTVVCAAGFVIRAVEKQAGHS